jgi:nucleoside-diphosphate-sugar epimerase
MKIVVTGASGLVGRYVVADLDARGYEVISADRTVPAALPGQSAIGDLTDMRHVEQVVAGADVVIHLARVPFPYAAAGYDAPDRIWRKPDQFGDAEKFICNLAITNNVLTAAQAAGVKKIVMGSSLTVYGLYYPSRPVMPHYLPVDEKHPRCPDDPYSLTKLIGEELADACVRWNSIQIASLRFPGVSGEDHRGFIEKRQNPMARGIGGLWTYLDVRDAATACRLAFERDFRGHEAFNICAPTTFMETPTEELARRFLPEVKHIGDAKQGNWAGYDTRKAAKVLGFEARHLVEL